MPLTQNFFDFWVPWPFNIILVQKLKNVIFLQVFQLMWADFSCLFTNFENWNFCFLWFYLLIYHPRSFPYRISLFLETNSSAPYEAICFPETGGKDPGKAGKPFSIGLWIRFSSRPWWRHRFFQPSPNLENFCLQFKKK